MQKQTPGAHLQSEPRARAVTRLLATYRVRATPASIQQRATAIAIEQSVELPIEAITDPAIKAEIVADVSAISDIGAGLFDVVIALSAATMPPEPGQLVNMLFGNTSLHDDVILQDVAFPQSYLTALGGPTHGITGLRALVAASDRALTATALKPQGLSPTELAKLAGAAAFGGIDVIKDDHGLADQAYSPFAARVAACTAAVALANRATGRRALYAPSLSGSLDQLRDQIRLVRDAGLRAVLIAPMVVGLPAFHALVRETRDIAFIAHPSFAGACKIAQPFLLGRFFRLLGADATIFPNYGGRFSFSEQTCRDIAMAALAPWGNIAACAPTPAGGMSLERIDEMLRVYGRDCMLLIGGNLLAEPERLSAVAKAFADKVAHHGQ